MSCISFTAPSQQYLVPHSIVPAHTTTPHTHMMESQNQNLLRQPLINSTHHHHHSADSRLEEVLSDPTLPWSKRILSATWIELNLLFPLAAPAILVYVFNNLMSNVTRAFAGHLGNLELAAANLGNSGIQLFAYGLMVNIHFISHIRRSISPQLGSIYRNKKN